MSPSAPILTYNVLSKQNAETSNAIIEHYKSNPDFDAFSQKEGQLILQRDEEDASKLQLGIDFAKKKGVIDPNFVPESYITIDVLGKTPDQVADEIISHVETEKEEDDGGGKKDDKTTKKKKKGSVIVLCGLSGTGKGTTVAKLRQKLENDYGHSDRVVCWSNGNIFRSVTLLAATWCEQQQEDCENGFDPEKALTKENLASFMSMLEFGKFNGKYDTRIHGLGLDMLVSEVQNTELKEPKVAKNIPTVAQFTQGEVILFAANAIRILGEDGYVVLVEGREQTVNYVRTPYRFTLVLSDDTLIGKRRAAQRLMAAALSDVGNGASVEQISESLDKHLQKMASE